MRLLAGATEMFGLFRSRSNLPRSGSATYLRLPNLGLPLLRKELHEQSARGRTYVVRVVYALLLFLAMGLWNSNELLQIGSRQFSASSTLGIGRQFFITLIWIQFIGVYLFLPAIVSGVVTAEKERNTLGLLLITKLSPWTILFEKFASRIIPMLTFLMISLPLISFTYALGGMESTLFFVGVWFLLLSILQVGSTALLASSFFGGTVGSFIGTYLLIAGFTIGPWLADGVIFHGMIYYIGRIIGAQLQVRGQMGLEFMCGEIALSMFNPPLILKMNLLVHKSSSFLGGALGATPAGTILTLAFLTGLPTLFLIAFNLSLARFFLVRRAFVTSTNPLLSLFKLLDRIFVRANDYVFRGAVLVRESHAMPHWDPVAWRETVKRSLGQFRYLVRVFVTLELPTGLLIYICATGTISDRGRSEPVAALMLLLWTISIALIAVTASNLIAGERSRQTLDVLLATPISGREIVRQKLKGVQRLMLVCAAPLLTCIAFQTWWRIELSQYQTVTSQASGTGIDLGHFAWLEYLVNNLIGLVILFHLAMWLSFWIGMNIRSTTKAILTSLGVIVAWCAAPIMLIQFISILLYGNAPNVASEPGSLLIYLLSPAFLVIFNEIGLYSVLSPLPYLPVILNTLLYGGLWLLIRHFVLANSDYRLSRLNSDHTFGASNQRLIDSASTLETPVA